MVRSYKKKGIFHQYSDDSFQAAIQAVKSGRMGVRGAGKRYGVPRSTLSDHLTGRVEAGSVIGRPPALPAKLEDELVDKAQQAATKGFGFGRRQMLARTGRVVKKLHLKTPFRQGIPGKDWFDGLRRRHPDLTIKKPLKLSVVRSRMLNQQVVNNYFTDLGRVVKDLGLSEKPSQIWNCDETGFQMEHNPTNVCARKGSKVAGRTSNSRESITSLLCVNASGEAMPPILIVKGKTKRSLQSWSVMDAPDGTVWSYQAKAWMEDVLGQEWFVRVFLKNCGPERPQLLLLDSHSSHEVLGVLEAAAVNDIHIMALPPHTTHHLQPLDKSVNGPLKAAYRRHCSEHMNEHPNNTISKSSWPAIFKLAWEDAVTAKNIKSGFRATGISPLDSRAIPKEAFAPSEAYANALPPPENTSITPSSSAAAATANNIEEPLEIAALPTEEAPVAVEPAPGSSSLADPFQTEAVAVTPLVGDAQVVHELPPDVSLDQLIESLSIPNVAVQVVQEDAIAVPLLSWNTEVESVFAIPQATSKPKSSCKQLTCHRLLTSDEVLSEKRSALEIKTRNEQEKLERKRKREQKSQKLMKTE